MVVESSLSRWLQMKPRKRCSTEPQHHVSDIQISPVSKVRLCSYQILIQLLHEDLINSEIEIRHNCSKINFALLIREELNLVKMITNMLIL